MTEPTPAGPPEAPTKPPEKSGSSNGVLLTIAGLALGIAIAGWVLASRQIDGLHRELAALQAAHRELAAQMMQGGRGASGAVGQTIDVAGAPARGRDDAVVTLVEFSDYECPFCIRHFKQTMPQIEQNYLETGKIRYVFRDFPIDQNHPEAIRAHQASRCALEQNKFWDLHARLFSAAGTHTAVALEARAREAGLNDAAFRTCLASGRTTRNIRETESVVQSLGATGTPWFLVGLRDLASDRVRILKSIGGAQPYEQFAIVLDAALREATR